MTIRSSGREPDELRPITFTRDFTEMAAGSVLVEFGNTRVLCTASAEDRVPPWLRGKGRGWVTAEYSMLPGSSPERVPREAQKGRPSGRTQEIQRLIGRALRAVTDLVSVGENQITVDCDVLQADGGTRVASICGGWIALHDACSRLVGSGLMPAHPITEPCAAISVGIVAGLPMLDLEYVEDVSADVDMNVVMTGSGRLIEVQGTAEGAPFSRAELDALIDLADAGIREIIEAQQELVREPPGQPYRFAVTLAFRLATGNPDKVSEIRSILVEALGAETVLIPDDSGVEETGTTLEENARLKAAAICDLRGEPALADDTGLEVDALSGAPGVWSARFAGPDATYADNVARLLHELSGREQADRGARFTTVAIARFPDGEEVLARGSVDGTIAEGPRGDGGFGYDPVFVPHEGDGRTFAEMSAREKHALSHRGRAFRALAASLAARAGGRLAADG